MAKTFKTGDLKEVGRIKVSAKGLREIANKLEQKTGSDTVVNLMVYLTPGETPTDYPDLGYDFGTISTEAKKIEEAPKKVKPAETKVEEVKPVVEETKKTEEKPAETPKAEATPKAEEVKPATPASAEAPKTEVPAPTAEEAHAKEIKEKAHVINTEANKDLSMEQPK